MSLVIILIVAGTAIVSMLWMYFINIYEVKYVASSELLYADNSSQLSIDVIPINSFGNRALFRSIVADFHIEEGKDLIDILSDKSNTNRFTIRSRKSEGEVVILIKCEKAYLPVKVEIPVRVKNKDNYL